jgi:hypothetical protein
MDKLGFEKALLQYKGYPVKITTVGGKFIVHVRNRVEVFDSLPHAIARSIGLVGKLDQLFQ